MLLAAIAEAQAVALTWSPHDRPDPHILALPVPASVLASGFDVDRRRAGVA